MEKLLLSRKEAAEALSISVDTLDNLCCRGLIRCCNIGARVLISASDLYALVDKLLKNGRA